MTIAEKITRAKADYDEVYEAGEKAENGRMWNAVLNDGNRTALTYAFNNWSCEYIRPNRQLVPTDPHSRNSTFSTNFKLKAVEKEYFDFSQCPRGAYASQGWHYTFTSCFDLEVIEDIGLCNANMFVHTFNWCGKLHTIECIYPDKDTKFDSAFNNCVALTHIRVNGVIGQDIDFKYCPLDVESALSVMRALRDFCAETLVSDDGYSYLDENGNGEIDDQDTLLRDSDGNVYFTFPTIYFSEHTLALLDSTDFSTYPAEELPFNAGDGWRVGVEAKRWDVG